VPRRLNRRPADLELGRAGRDLIQVAVNVASFRARRRADPKDRAVATEAREALSALDEDGFAIVPGRVLAIAADRLKHLDQDSVWRVEPDAWHATTHSK
jgi:hypothetical protein